MKLSSTHTSQIVVDGTGDHTHCLPLIVGDTAGHDVHGPRFGGICSFRLIGLGGSCVIQCNTLGMEK